MSVPVPALDVLFKEIPLTPVLRGEGKLAVR